MLLDYIQKKPAQPKISFDEIRELIAMLWYIDNDEMLIKQQGQLEEVFIA
jgi:hypothetical protein